MAISHRASARIGHDSAQDVELLLGVQGIANLRRCTAILIVVGLAVALNDAIYADFGIISLSGLVVSAIGILAYGMIVRGHMLPAIRTLIWGAGLLAIGVTFQIAGLRTPALIFIPILCMAAAWLLSFHDGIALATVAMAAIVFHVLAEQYGYVAPNISLGSQSYALVYLFALIGAAAVALGSTRSFQMQLRRTLNLTEDLQRKVEALSHSEQRFLALFRANPVPSSTNTLDGRLIDVNDAWVALYGIPAQDAIGKTVKELGIWREPEERKRVFEEMALRGRVDGAAVTLYAAGRVRKPFLLYIAPVEFGDEQRLVCSILDQSDRQAAEAAQHAINEALEQRVAERTAELTQTVQTLTVTQAELVEAEKLASLGTMVAGISHQLNTPLGNAVTVASTLRCRASELKQLVASDQLRRSSLSDFLEQLEEMAGMLLRSTEKAAELVRRFKELAVDRASERRRLFTLQDLVQDIVNAVQSGVDKPQVAIQQDVPYNIVCDNLPGPVGQVLTNLLQNAMLHAFTGGAQGRIVIAANVKGNGASARVILRVRDDGLGMSEHTRLHVFDPFFTTRMGQGTGLGLSLSYRLATSTLGGSLSVESTPGNGSCFTFCFPQDQPPSPLTASSPPESPH